MSARFVGSADLKSGAIQLAIPFHPISLIIAAGSRAYNRGSLLALAVVNLTHTSRICPAWLRTGHGGPVTQHKCHHNNRNLTRKHRPRGT